MSSSPPAPLLDVELRPGEPAQLNLESPADAPGWAVAYRELVRAAVVEHGALVVRGLGLRRAEDAAAVFRALGHLMPEREAFAPRRSYGDCVYSSAKWPQNQPMCMHHELSYRREFPSLMLFACLDAPAGGGATGVADARSVLEALPADLVQRFEQTGWLLVRNYNEEIGSSVAEAFGTDDRHAVEAYCNANAIRFEWQSDGTLRTWQRRSAVLRHPVSGERCWFNQIAFLNRHTLDPEVGEFLVEMYGEDGLPFNTCFGDGAPIDEEVVAQINAVYERHTRRRAWQVGDLMVVDNVRTAHSREPYDGRREVLVAMADAVRLDECAPVVEAAA